MACCCTSAYADSQLIRMYDKADYERHLSVRVDSYCRLLESWSPANNELKIDIDPCCIDSPFDKAWSVQRPQYWVGVSDFEMRAWKRHQDPSARVLVGWQTVQLLASCLRDRLCVGAEPFEWFLQSSHWLLVVLTPPALA